MREGAVESCCSTDINDFCNIFFHPASKFWCSIVKMDAFQYLFASTECSLQNDDISRLYQACKISAALNYYFSKLKAPPSLKPKALCNKSPGLH